MGADGESGWLLRRAKAGAGLKQRLYKSYMGGGEKEQKKEYTNMTEIKTNKRKQAQRRRAIAFASPPFFVRWPPG